MARALFVTLVALAAGASLAAQAPINARLRQVLNGSTLGSALVSVGVSLLVLAAALLIIGRGVDTVRLVGDGPWWVYVGGGLGVAFLVATVVAVSYEGVAFTFIGAMAGQVAAALVIDRFGLFGVTPIELSWQRIVAMCLTLAALALLLHDSMQRSGA